MQIHDLGDVEDPYLLKKNGSEKPQQRRKYPDHLIPPCSRTLHGGTDGYQAAFSVLRRIFIRVFPEEP
nr:hypothetical protein [uncultured Methanospirillum sp.]